MSLRNAIREEKIRLTSLRCEESAPRTVAYSRDAGEIDTAASWPVAT